MATSSGELLLNYTDLFAWSAFLLSLVLGGSALVFAAQNSLANNFYDGDVLSASASALTLCYFISPPVILLAFADSLSRVGGSPHQRGAGRDRPNITHSGDFLSTGRALQTIVGIAHVFLLCASVAAVLILVVMASYQCTTRHADTACKSTTDRALRWQHVVALIITPLLSLALGLMTRALFRFRNNLFRTRREVVLDADQFKTD